MAGRRKWLLLLHFFIVACGTTVIADGSTVRPCNDEKIPCDNFQCIWRNRWCNGVKDCTDESDENYCQKTSYSNWYSSDPNKCRATHFLCRNGQCVPFSVECDGHFDCEDRSDEANCGIKNTSTKFPDTVAAEQSNSEEKGSGNGFNNFHDNIYTRASEESEELPIHSFTETPLREINGDLKTNVEKKITENRPLHSTNPRYPSTETYIRTSYLVDTRQHRTTDPLLLMSRTTQKDLNQQRLASTTLYPIVRRRNYDHDRRTKNDRKYRTLQKSRTDQNVNSYNYYQERKNTRQIPQRGLQNTNDYGCIQKNYKRDYKLQPDFNQRRFENNYYSPNSADHRPCDEQISDNDNCDTRIRNGVIDNTRPVLPPTVPPSTVLPQPSNSHGQKEPCPSNKLPYAPAPVTPDPFRPIPPPREPIRPHFNPHVEREPCPRVQPSYAPTTPKTLDPIQQTSEPSRPLPLHPTDVLTTPIPCPRAPHSPPLYRPWHSLPIHQPVYESAVYNRRKKALKPFSFSVNYTSLYAEIYAHAVSYAEQWLLEQRKASTAWAEDMPRVIVTLSLINNSFYLKNSPESDVIRKNFQVQLGVNLLRNSSKISSSRLALFVNAMLASCLDPRDFMGQDVVKLLQKQALETRQRGYYVNPYVYLSLCLAGAADPQAQESLEQMANANHKSERRKDMRSLALLALNCYLQEIKESTHLRSKIHSSVHLVLQQRKEDGSFGSKYSTALAAHALLSLDTDIDWNPEKTMDFLVRQQDENGSFGDILSTYYILPLLGGRSWLHLRNIQCDPPKVDRDLTPEEIIKYPGPKQDVHYYLKIEYPTPITFSITLNVPIGINLFDVMRVASHLNGNFRFSYGIYDDKMYVNSISNISNDPEMGLYWQLYIKDYRDDLDYLRKEEHHTEDIRDYVPKSSEIVIFTYRPVIQGIPEEHFFGAAVH